MKKLGLALAITTAIMSNVVLAQTNLDDLEKRLDALEKNESSDLIFYGYARYGIQSSDNGIDKIEASGQLANNAAGRLGNEDFGGEFGWIKPFTGINGTKWDLNVMLEEWGDVKVKKFFAGVSNVFESQPDLYIWAGRDFHQRPQESLNDYFFMEHDGQGGGFKNLKLGMMNADFGVVQRIDDDDTGLDESDNLAITSKFGFKFADNITLDILANYGFAERSQKDNIVGVLPAQDAGQIGAMFNYSGHKINLRYGLNADNSVFNRVKDLETIYASYQYALKVNEQIDIEYLLAMHSYSLDQKEKSLEDRINYSAIVRPMYAWNDTHSTWLEAGYSLVDYDDADDKNGAWKLTLSQNISINSAPFGRPMLRFYATWGEADNNVDSTGALIAASDTKQDAFLLGAMFEAWW